MTEPQTRIEPNQQVLIGNGLYTLDVRDVSEYGGVESGQVDQGGTTYTVQRPGTQGAWWASERARQVAPITFDVEPYIYREPRYEGPDDQEQMTAHIRQGVRIQTQLLANFEANLLGALALDALPVEAQRRLLDMAYDYADEERDMLCWNMKRGGLLLVVERAAELAELLKLAGAPMREGGGVWR
jgi:hypothetical protein